MSYGVDGKPNAKGRDSGNLTQREKKLRQPPAGEPWVWTTRELLESPSWQAQSINGRRLMDFLLLDHMGHAGKENGRLMATYDQLVKFGITRRKITAAIRELEFLGLVECEHGGRYNMSNRPSTYRLTFYYTGDGIPATNQWKTRTQEQIDRWKMSQKKQKKLLRRGTTIVPPLELRAINGGKSSR